MADFGIFTFATEYSMPPDALSLATEQRGFESLFLPDHTHIPVSRERPPGGRPNRDQVAMYLDAGFNRVVFHVPPAGEDKVTSLLDRYAAISAEFA